MYTKKISYATDAALKKYEFELEENENLIKIMEEILSHFTKVAFKDINKLDNNYVISFINNKNELEAIVDLEKGKLIIESMDKDTKIIKNISKYCDILEGLTYNKRNRLVISDTDFSRMYTFRYVDDKNSYYIILRFKYKKKEIMQILCNLLDENRSINSIRDIYYAISEVVDLTDKSLVIQTSNNQNIINIYDGKLMNYVEYRKLNNYEEKMYLENGEFYIEKRVKENLPKERLPFVKKLDGHYE